MRSSEYMYETALWMRIILFGMLVGNKKEKMW